MFGIKKKDQAGWPAIQFALQHGSADVLERRLSTLANEKRNGICSGDGDHDCLTNLRFADDVLLFASTKERLQKMLCDVKHRTDKVGLKKHSRKIQYS